MSEQFTVMEWDGDAPGIGYEYVTGVEALLARLQQPAKYDHRTVDDASAISLCEMILELRSATNAQS